MKSNKLSVDDIDKMITKTYKDSLNGIKYFQHTITISLVSPSGGKIKTSMDSKKRLAKLIPSRLGWDIAVWGTKKIIKHHVKTLCPRDTEKTKKLDRSY